MVVDKPEIIHRRLNFGRLRIVGFPRAGIYYIIVVLGGLYLPRGAHSAISFTLDFSNGSPLGDVLVGLTGEGAVNVDGGSTLNSANFFLGTTATGDGSAAISDAGSIISSTGFRVGDAGTGAMTIQNGGSVSSSSLIIGNVSTGSGSITVTGAGSSIATSSVHDVGFLGSGTLQVLDGAAVSAAILNIGNEPGSSGTVTVNGTSSMLTTTGESSVGEDGAGTLNIESGGSVSVGSFMEIGDDPESTGTVTIKGAGSMLTTTEYLSVGEDAAGTLNIESAGSVSVGSFMEIGDDPESTGTVTIKGAGSMLTTTEYLSVGEDAAGTLNIESAGSVSVGSFMEIGDDPESTGTVTIKGAGSMLTTTEYLSVGEDAAGTLNIESAGSVSVGSFMEIGDDPESTGTVTIKGAGSMLTTTEYLSVGEDAAGTLNIESAGSVSVGSFMEIGDDPGSTGAVTIKGAGSMLTTTEYLSVGEDAAGTLNIESGGSASIGSFMEIGGDPGSSGTATVSGANSMLTVAGELEVGNEGTGTLELRDGASFSIDKAGIGNFSGSSGLVSLSGAGSTFVISTELEIAAGGNGTLQLAAGTVADTASTFIGRFKATTDGTTVTVDNGTGAVQVTGLGASLTTTTLTIGQGGAGQLTVEGGATLSSTQGNIGAPGFSGFIDPATFDIGTTPGGSLLPFTTTSGDGTAEVAGSGSSWSLSGSLYVGGDETGAAGDGALLISDGAQVSVGIGQEIRIWNTGSVRGNDGTLVGDVFNEGLLAPGTSTGTFTIDGNFAQMVGATLEIEIAGLPESGLFDLLQVTGDASLGGTLLLDFSALPSAFGNYDFLDVGGTLTGTFDTIDITGLDPGRLDLSSISSGLLGVAIPEPGTLALVVGSALFAMIIRRR